MASPVKTIFKTILFTYIGMFTICLLVEFCNVTLYSSYINSYLRTSIRKSCEYFSSETYRSGRALVNLPASSNGISSEFYQDGDEDNIWHSLYDNVSFSNWTTEHIEKANGNKLAVSDWQNINMNMYYYCNNDYIGKYYKDALMTPTNLGIPYIGYIGDDDSRDTSLQTTEHIAQWLLTQLLSNGNTDKIEGTGNNTVVNYNGYLVSTGRLRITETKYKIYDLQNSDEQEAFRNVTNMEGATIAGNAQTSSGKYAMTVELEFSVPIEYEGITPFKRLFSWIANGASTNAEVGTDGMFHNNSTDRLTPDAWLNGVDETAGTLVDSGGWNSDNINYEGTMTGGGANGQTRFASSKIVYYLIH